MKKIVLILITIMAFQTGFGQDTYDWKDTAPNGDWKYDGSNDSTDRWYNNGDSTNRNTEPDEQSILRFNNNTYVNMNNNVDAGYKVHQLIFGSSNDQSRTISGNDIVLAEDINNNYRPKIENQSSAEHTVNLNITLQNKDLEVNPVSGNLILGGTINNNGHYILIWGDNSHTVQFNDVISGTGGFSVEENSIVYFNAVNTYTGTTNLSSGELIYEKNNAISDNSNLSLNGGTLNSDGWEVEMNTLILADDSTIKCGSGSHFISFDDSSGETWTSGKTLTIEGWGTGVDGYITIGSDDTGLTTTQLGQITFDGHPAGARILSDGQIVPIDYDADVDDDSITQPGSALLDSMDDSDPSDPYEVFKFNINDNLNDGLDTKVTNIHLVPDPSNTASWANNIGGVVVKYVDANNNDVIVNTGTPTITDTGIDIPIQSGDLTITENDMYFVIKIFIYLADSDLEDGKILKFMIDADNHGFTSDTNNGSFFLNEFPADIVSNNFTVRVVATELRFTQQPSDVEIGTPMSPSVVVSATDANGNIDKDFDDTDGTVYLDVSGSNFDADATDAVDAVNGVATFDNLIFDTAGMEATLTTDNGENLTNVTSEPFKVNLATEECSQLFISEYGNASGGNYLEIYNPSGIEVDMSNYQVWRALNGGAWEGAGTTDIVSLSGTLAPGGVFIVARDSDDVSGADKYDSDMDYNGDDNIGLAWNGGSGTDFNLIDSVGDENGDPGTGWDIGGEDNDATYNHTLIRKKEVNKPNTNWNESAANEWDVYEYSQINLGSHISNCNYYPCTATSETAIFIDFDNNNSGWTSSTTANDGDKTYFDRIQEGDVSGYVDFTNDDGYFFAAMNTDDSPVSNNSPEFYINDINISGLNNLQFSIMIAEDDRGSYEDWDSNTRVHILYDIDNSGTFKDLLWIESTHATDANYPPAIDIDVNGTGNTTYEITDSFVEFKKDIKGKGSDLDIKIVFENLNGLDEDIAFDNIKITGDKIPTATYASGSWDVTPDDITKQIVIDDNLSTSSGDIIKACKCQIKSDTLTINDNSRLLVAGSIHNEGTIIIKNEGSLVQMDNKSAITGGANAVFQLTKTSQPLDNYYDYVYWSSPINSTTFTLGDIVPSAWRYFAFDPNEADNTHTYPGWVLKNSTDVPDKGVGYAISATSGHTAGNSITAQFVKDHDPFNNGDIIVPILSRAGSAADAELGKENLIGNPYPSAIDFNKFANNNTAINASYSLWTNCAGLSGNAHQESGYTTYVVSGTSTAACDGTAQQGGTAGQYIATGQGFMVTAAAAPDADATVTFKNDYRVTDNNDGFMNRPQQQNIVWIDLRDDNGKFNQIAVGFYNNATDTFDRNFDALNMNTGNGFALYSIVDTKKLVIQGLPELIGTDKIVPLGVESDIARTITLHINHTEGLTNEYIYVRDLYLNTIHDLKATDYITTVTSGDFTDRFELVFTQQAMSMEDIMLDPNAVLLTQQTGTFNLVSNNEMNITGVTVYDITGKVLYNNQDIDATSHQIDLQQIATGNMLIFRVQMNNESIVVKKTIKK